MTGLKMKSIFNFANGIIKVAGLSTNSYSLAPEAERMTELEAHYAHHAGVSYNPCARLKIDNESSNERGFYLPSGIEPRGLRNK
jgi:hypothetical protein